MDITIKDFANKGAGWYLRLNGMAVGIILPSDLPAIVQALKASDQVQQEVREAVNAHYAQLEAANG